MKTKFMRIILIQLFTILISILIFYFINYNKKHDSKVLFIDNIKLFEKFQMKKDFDLVIENELNSENKYLDSLSRAIVILEKNKNVAEIENLKSIYVQTRSNFEKKFSSLSTEYTNKVMSRLNEYIDLYGKKYGASIIIGGNGSANVLFVSNKIDVTNSLIEFVNKRYLNSK